MRALLPLMILIEVVASLAMVFGFALFIPHLDATAAGYLATGAFSISLLSIGLSIIPQRIAQNRVAGSFDYMATLPVPRLAIPASELTVWIAASLPGAIVALAITSIRFGFALSPSPAVVPVVLVVAITAAAVGYAVAMALPPTIAPIIGSFMGTVLIFFSPLSYPADRLPGWLLSVHAVLPVRYMGDMVRWSLTGKDPGNLHLGTLVLAAWFVISIAATARAASVRS